MNIPSSRKPCPLRVGITRPVAGSVLTNFPFCRISVPSVAAVLPRLPARFGGGGGKEHLLGKHKPRISRHHGVQPLLMPCAQPPHSSVAPTLPLLWATTKPPSRSVPPAWQKNRPLAWSLGRGRSQPCVRWLRAGIWPQLSQKGAARSSGADGNRALPAPAPPAPVLAELPAPAPR